MRYDVQGYEEDVEKKMGMLYARLSEMDRRRYAAVEAVKLGHGGIEYVSALFAAQEWPGPTQGAQEEVIGRTP